MLTLNVTGHRQVVPANLVGPGWPDQNPIVKQHHVFIESVVVHLLTHWCRHDSLRTCITGMALGADQIFAEAVIRMRDAGLPLKLVAAVPFLGQESKWNIPAQKKYREILNQCDSVQIVSEGAYTPYKMQIRNEWMVNNSNFTLAIWNGAEKGGTWNCIQYARKLGKQIWQLHSETGQFRSL